MVGLMTASAEKMPSGFELLRAPATLALAQYLDDLNSVLGFEAFLWTMVVKTDYIGKPPKRRRKRIDQLALREAVGQFEIHSVLLGEMVFCQGVNSFQTYLANLMTLIYEKYPKKLSSNKQMTYQFCIEHHMAGDLIAALADKTATELTHQRLDDLAKHFEKKLDLPLFTTKDHSTNATLCVDIRNLMTHNRGIVNRFFIQRNPQFTANLGTKLALGEQDRRKMLSSLAYCARQLDIRAIKKFRLNGIQPEFKD